MAPSECTRYLDDGTPYRVTGCTEPSLHVSREQWKKALRESFTQLSPQSRWQRFASGLAGLTEAQLDYLTDVDGSNRVAFCAVIPDARQIRGIGIARYFRSEEQPESAEFAVTVIDSYQGQGVGRALLERLIELARSNGIDSLTGSVLPSNTGMLTLCRSLGAKFGQADATILVRLATRR
jgi:GNAT superfamily N-acetyltransferase